MSHSRAARHRVPDEEVAALASARDALRGVPADEALVARALIGAGVWADELVERLRGARLSLTFDELRRRDGEEWWQLEELLKQRDMHLALLAALCDPQRREQALCATRSTAFARHRDAVAAVMERAVPDLLLSIVDDPSVDGDSLSGWLPPYQEAPWAVVLTRPLARISLEPVLLHELVHASQERQLSPLDGDPDVEWVLEVGNTTVREGATETLVQLIPAARARAVYRVEVETFAWLSERASLVPVDLARSVSATTYPLGLVADLLDCDDEALAWQILEQNAATRGRTRASG